MGASLYEPINVYKPVAPNIGIVRRAPPRLRLHGSDRALLIWLTRIWPNLLDLSRVVKPETILRWHRSGFKAFWRWKSRHRAGRPKIDRGLRDLIQRMSRENPLWGASRIHGELLMLGFEVAQSTVSKYLVRPAKPPSQTWKTFLQNHAEAIAAIDMCVVPTLTFDLLFAFLVLGHARRQLLWFEVTRHPTAEWLARQITEAFPWASAPLSRHLFRQQVNEGFFPLFKPLSHALKKDGRALYRVILTGTIDLPAPGLGRIPSPLHDERKIGWVEFFTHAP